MINTQPALVRATSGPLAGHTTAPVDVALLRLLHVQCVTRRVRYRMGAKARELDAVPLDTPYIDCSGYGRWLLWHATHGALLLPDGSWNQGEALRDRAFKPSTPDALALRDNHVRACVHVADDRDGTGHFWIVLNGVTYESRGGKGVDSRPFDVRLSCGFRLDQLATQVYVLC